MHGREWGNTSGEKGREPNRKGGNYSRDGRVEPGKPITTRVDTRTKPNRTTRYRRNSEEKNTSETGDPETPSKDREGVHLRGEREGPEERKPLKGKKGGTGQRPKGSREPGAKEDQGAIPFRWQTVPKSKRLVHKHWCGQESAPAPVPVCVYNSTFIFVVTGIGAVYKSYPSRRREWVPESRCSSRRWSMCPRLPFSNRSTRTQRCGPSMHPTIRRRSTRGGLGSSNHPCLGASTHPSRQIEPGVDLRPKAQRRSAAVFAKAESGSSSSARAPPGDAPVARAPKDATPARPLSAMAPSATVARAPVDAHVVGATGRAPPLPTPPSGASAATGRAPP